MHLSAQTSIIKKSNLLNSNKSIIWGLLSLLFTFSAHSSGYYNSFFGFKRNTPMLVFTSTAQSITASLCSGNVVIQSKNTNGSAKNVSSDLIVNLTGPAGVSFYSDPDCVVAVTSVTISNGTSSANFYFSSSGTGSVTLTATAPAYVSGQQIETLAANAFVWTGGGGNSNWATNANWSGGTAPGSGDIAVFNGTCSSNCSPTMTSDPNVQGVRVNSGYSGTITQSSGVTMTIGTKGWIHNQGTFAGGNSAINSSGAVAIAGGTFTNTSGTLSVVGYACGTTTVFYKVGGTFSHNNGITKFTGASNGFCHGSYTVAGTSAIDFYHLEFDNYFSSFGDGSSYYSTQTLNVAGNLTVGATAGETKVYSATINLMGDLISLPGATGGDATINIIGNGTQKYFGSTGVLPAIVVNTTGSLGPDIGTTNLNASMLTIQQGAFTAPSGTFQLTGAKVPNGCSTATLFNKIGGTFSHNNGTTKLTGATNSYCNGNYTIAGTSAINFYHLEFDNYYASFSENGSYFYSTQTLNVAGNLTIGATAGVTKVYSATINLIGNLISLSGAAGGDATINIIGNGTQKYFGSTGTLPAIVVNTTGSLGPDIGTTNLNASTLTIQQGTFTAPTGTLTLVGTACGTENLFNKTGGTFSHNNGTTQFTGASNGYCNGNYTITSVSALSFYHLKFDNYATYSGNGSIYSANQTLNVAGNLTIGATVGMVKLDSTNYNLSGNLSVIAGANGGTASLNFVGSSTQTLSQDSGAIMCTGTVSLNKTGGSAISLSSDLTLASTDWTVTTGAINMNNYNLTIQGLTLGGTTLTKGGGVLTVNGSVAGTGAIYGGTVAP